MIEKIAAFMEDAAEVATFLEADVTSEILMGISKEMVEKLQTRHSNLSNSTNGEEEITHKLQDCVNQLHAREPSIFFTLNHDRMAELITDNVKVTGLREMVWFLEEKLRITESRLEESKSLNETSQHKLREMRCEMEALRETLFVAERRAENAEEKASHLTESNPQLMEELDFLEGSNEGNTRKASKLEKQVRELDIQLQHARASSKASQEQQNILYLAIWDMETLINELKQKVTQSESMVENAEVRCTSLLETNLEMNKEVEVLRSRVEAMERSLKKSTAAKESCAEDISIRTGLIMDMVMQLALERERIQNQLVSVAEENRLLTETLQKERKLMSRQLGNNQLDSIDSESAETDFSKFQTDVIMEPDIRTSNRDNKLPAPSHKCSCAAADWPAVRQGRGMSENFVFIAILIVMSILSAHLFQKALPFLETYREN